MATHSSSLSWRIPWTEDPGGLQSMGSQRGRPDLKGLRTYACPLRVGLGYDSWVIALVTILVDIIITFSNRTGQMFFIRLN